MKKVFSLFRFLFFAFFVSSIFPVFALIKFDNLDLNSSDFLFFSAQHDIPGIPSYKTLFLTQLGEKSIKKEPMILTCFPEKMELLCSGKVLQVRNRYGTALYSPEENSLKWVSLASSIPVNYTHEGFFSVSPDGNYFCYVRQTRNTIGQLVIVDSSTRKEKVIVEKTSFNYKSLSVKWSPDSKVLLYEKDGDVYFVMPSEVFGKMNLSESYRKIGSGTINSVQWTNQNSLIYLKDDIVYSVDENELYTRGLYSSLIGYGKILALLPNSFDSVKDRFWTNGNGTKIVTISEKNTVFVYSFSSNDELKYMKSEDVFPLIDFKDSAYSFEVFWSLNSTPVLWVNTLTSDGKEKLSRVYLLKEKMEFLFEAHSSIPLCLSPDKRKIAYTDFEKFCVYDLALQKNVLEKEDEKIVSAVWNGNFSIYVGGGETVRLINLSGEDKLLFLSSACNPSWSGERIVCKTRKNVSFVYDSDKNVWEPFFSLDEKSSPSEKNGRYRVFLGAALNPSFENSIYIRSLSGKVKTYSVYKQTEKSGDRPKRAVLVFDAMENSEGLPEILYTLNEFDLKATFFLNGEFIRRYPKKAKQVFTSGNECASMFFSPADLTEGKFVVDKDFIRRGLARNEDEFFNVTGKELSLYWHAPFYHSTDLIKEAGKDAGYSYVESFTDFSDTLSFEKSRETSVPYLSAGELIDAFTENLYDGIIIPVSVGKGEGIRSDYLYEKLDLLISAILDSGYEIVSLRTLELEGLKE